MWSLLLASTDPSDPAGWITQAGLGVALLLCLVAIRWLVKKVEQLMAVVMEALPLLAEAVKVLQAEHERRTQ